MNIGKRHRDDRGFTLIELLIVITVLGILAGIALVAVGSTRKDSVKSACKTDFRSIELSAESVQTKTGAYPVASAVGSNSQSALNSAYGGASGLINLNNTATNGALLRNNYPYSTDYVLSYVGTATNYTITIKKGDLTNPTFVSPQSPTDPSGCDAL